MVTNWNLWGKPSTSGSGSKSDWSNTSQDKNSTGARKKDDWQVVSLQKPQQKKHTSFGGMGLGDNSSSNGGWGAAPCNNRSYNFPQAVAIPKNNEYYGQHKKLLKSENQVKKQGMFSSTTEDNCTKRRDERSLSCQPSKNNTKSGHSSSPSGNVVHDWVNSMDK